jgi:hypothetical protein
LLVEEHFAEVRRSLTEAESELPAGSPRALLANRIEFIRLALAVVDKFCAPSGLFEDVMAAIEHEWRPIDIEHPRYRLRRHRRAFASY